MNAAVVSLIAFVIAIIVSCFSPINVGFLSIALAFLVGSVFGGLPVSAIVSGFPASLFLTLTGVTLLFAQARVNGTLDKVASYAVRLARGNRGLMPVIFFGLGLALASIGAGNIAATALLAPVAMSVAGEAGISGFLMALMLCNGANAGGLSPFAPTGIIARNLMLKAGIEGGGWANFFNSLAAQSFVAFSGYLLFGGLRLFRRGDLEGKQRLELIAAREVEPLDRAQRATLAVIGLLVAAVIAPHLAGLVRGGPVYQLDVGMAAFVAAVLLSIARAADEEKAVRAMPWGVIVMVSGVTVLVGVLEKTGGMDLFTHLLALLSSPAYATGMIALVTGIISVYSSSSGVVLPAFLPAIPGLVAKLGGGNPLMIAYSINVGAHLVDVSPLSTLGALCLACAAPEEDRTVLFRKLMIWGWSMALVGAAVCQLFFGYR
jgi:di/tricarboxylate transporter